MEVVITAEARQEAGRLSKSDERLAELYSTHAAAAVRLAFLLTSDREAAEDIAHDAFVRVGGKILTLREPERAAGYLFRTVANLAKDHGRRVARSRDLERRRTGTRPNPHVDFELRDEVLSALVTIDPRYRLVLFLRYYLDMSEHQAAEAMGCTTAAVKSLTNRAARALRARLEGEADG